MIANGLTYKHGSGRWQALASLLIEELHHAIHHVWRAYILANKILVPCVRQVIKSKITSNVVEIHVPCLRKCKSYVL